MKQSETPEPAAWMLVHRENSERQLLWEPPKKGSTVYREDVELVPLFYAHVTNETMTKTDQSDTPSLKSASFVGRNFVRLDFSDNTWQEYRIGGRELFEILVKRLSEVTRERGWIPVTERLPGYDTVVIASFGSRSTFAYLDGSSDKWTAWFLITGFMDAIEPSHWMPLPPGPETGTQAATTLPTNEHDCVAAERELEALRGKLNGAKEADTEQYLAEVGRGIGALVPLTGSDD